LGIQPDGLGLASSLYPPAGLPCVFRGKLLEGQRRVTKSADAFCRFERAIDQGVYFAHPRSHQASVHGKDLLDDGFGRFRELPLGLARLGRDVTGIAISYRRRKEGTVVDCELSAKVSCDLAFLQLDQRCLTQPECGAAR
jgi:hypothetical protein